LKNKLQDSKIKPGPIHNLKTIKQPQTQIGQTTDTTQNSRTLYLEFIITLTPSAKKTVNLHVFKSVYKPRNINVLFSQCGSQQHGRVSHQK